MFLFARFRIFSVETLQIQPYASEEKDHKSIQFVVIAGDVNLGIKGLHWIQSRIKNKPVIYVLGNHEYYKNSYPKIFN